MRHLESKLQTACVKWFRLSYPKLLIFAIPNGGKRNMIEAMIMKGEGVTAGVPDLFVPVCLQKGELFFGGIFIEMKSEKGKQTDSQKQMAEKLRQLGYIVEVCNSIDNFIETVKKYLK